jgi:predicted dehydrogenase
MSPKKSPTRKTVRDPSFSGLSFLVVGLGSIGSRHLKNLTAMGIEAISLLRSGSRGLESRFPYPAETDLDRALDKRPSAVIISNPTSCHLDTALAAAQAGCHLLIEKPVSHSWSGVQALRRVVRDRSLIVVTGFQFRFHPLLLTAKRWVEEGRMGRIVSCRAEYGEYLPSWHPEEDYRRGYSAQTSLGGGPVLTLSHPFDYLRWLLGDVRSVSGATSRRSHLEIDTEDTANALLRFESGVLGAVELDYVQHPRRHALQIVGEGGTVRLDFEAGSLQLAPPDGRPPVNVFLPPGFERNAMFFDEMSNFLSALIGREAPVCTLDDGIRALQISLAVHRSSEGRREVDVGHPL